MKVKIRCVIISVVIISVCIGFYYLATFSAQSTGQDEKRKFVHSIEFDDDDGDDKKAEREESKTRIDSNSEVDDHKYAVQQRAAVERKRHTQKKGLLKQKTRDENDNVWGDDNSSIDAEKEEEPIELDERPKPSAAVSNREKPVHKTRFDEIEDNEYVSIDDVKDTDGTEDVIVSRETERRHEAGVVSDVMGSMSGKQDKLYDDLGEVEIDPSELESRSAEVQKPERVQSVHQTSHLRSHNIAPVPRVPAQSILAVNKLHDDKVKTSHLLDSLRTRGPKITLDDFGVGQMPADSPGGVSVSQAQSYFLIHGGRASKMNRAVRMSPLPSYIPADHYIFTSDSLPVESRLRPSIGNGFLSTVVHGPDIYMSGLYNGQGSQSHRAAIPSTCSFRIASTNPVSALNRTYQLDVGSGIFSELITGPTFNITQQFYAHRSLPNLIVVEVDLVRSNTQDVKSVLLELNHQWTASYDLTFVKQLSGKEEVSYKIGTVKAAESENQAAKEVHIMYDHIPSELVSPVNVKHAKWIFLTSIGLSKEETELYYDSGVQRIHAQDSLYLSHVRGWASTWLQGRVDVEGNAQIARATYASWYYMLSSMPLKYSTNFAGLSASGLPLGDFGKDYQGHIMDDQELWMFPPLLLFQSDLANHIISARKRRQVGARRDAVAAARKGALYPSHSGALGRELGSGTETGLYRPYVGAGIVWSVLQSVYASGNSSSVTQSALANMITEICHCLLGSVRQHNSKLSNEVYGIYNVTSIDNNHRLLDNSPYINGIVKLALSAPSYIYGMENKTTTDFDYYASRIKVAVEDGIHPAYEGYKQGLSGIVFSHPDAVLLGYPLMFPMEPSVRRNDLLHYEQVIARESSSLNMAMHAVGWLELGESDKAAASFQKQLLYIKNNFQVWCNSTVASPNNAYNYLPAAGAYLQSIVNGYGGVRLHNDHLAIDPSLPSGVTRLHFVGIDYRGSHLDIVVSSFEIMITVTSANRYAPTLRVFVFNPQSTYTLNPSIEVRFSRQRAVISIAKLPPLVSYDSVQATASARRTIE